MGLFNRKQEPQDGGHEYDPERHELIEVHGQDDGGATCHEYVRDKRTRQIIGRPAWTYSVEPLDAGKRRK